MIDTAHIGKRKQTMALITKDRPAAVALGAMTGARYIESLRDGREVWIDGERVDDVTVHPAFKDMIGELARLLRPAEQPRSIATR